MSMKPYFEFAKDKNNMENIMNIQFNSGLKTAMVDYYCTNPDCDCVVITLNFVALEQNDKLKGSLFAFDLDTRTWEVSEIRIDNPSIGVHALIEEFTSGLDMLLKEIFRKRIKEAKEYGGNGVLDWFDNLSDEDGFCFGYSEVYGESDTPKFFFDYMDEKYFVDDQYCTNPECKCNDVVLTFFDIIPDRDKQEAQFALRVSLGTGKYKVECSYDVDKGEIEKIFNSYLEHIHNDLGLLRSRYAKMKEFGKKRILRKKQKQNPQKVASIKVGRNDPCPCGSGKKYKKCCGT